MTRILLGGISLLSPLTGIGQYTKHLASELCALDQEVHFFLGDHWEKFNPLEKIRAQYYRSSLANQLVYKIKRKIPGFRHALYCDRQTSFQQGATELSKLTGSTVYHEPNFIPWKTDLPTVITVHDLSWIRYPETHPIDRVRWLNSSIEQALNHAKSIIVVSQFIQNEILEIFGDKVAQKTSVIHNGVSCDFRPYESCLDLSVITHYGLKPQSFFLALGTLEPRKNLGTIIKAYKCLASSIRDQYPLVIVGDQGWLAGDLKQYLDASIRYLGYVPQQRLISLLASAKALVYGSLYEGFGLPILEAMASKVPVIASKASALQEVSGNHALHVHAHDIGGFTIAMEQIISNPSLEKEITEAAFARSKSFTWKSHAQRTLQIYQNLE
jgi:alpha-1,3-rhamnosyl/mannosyltransferase